jgi:hypothetical protein
MIRSRITIMLANQATSNEFFLATELERGSTKMRSSSSDKNEVFLATELERGSFLIHYMQDLTLNNTLPPCFLIMWIKKIRCAYSGLCKGYGLG